MSNNSQKRSRIYLAFANQNLISRITEMKHPSNNQGILNQAMVSISEDFETILRGQGLFKCNVPPNSTLIIATKTLSKAILPSPSEDPNNSFCFWL